MSIRIFMICNYIGQVMLGAGALHVLLLTVAAATTAVLARYALRHRDQPGDREAGQRRSQPGSGHAEGDQHRDDRTAEEWDRPKHRSWRQPIPPSGEPDDESDQRSRSGVTPSCRHSS